MKWIYFVCSYLGAFTIGAYCISQFKFHQPIEGYRWAITSIAFLVMLCSYLIENKEN